MEIAASDCLPSFDVEIIPGESASLRWEGDGTSAKSPFLATVTMNRELHQPGSDRSCLHVEVDIDGCEVCSRPPCFNLADHSSRYSPATVWCNAISTILSQVSTTVSMEVCFKANSDLTPFACD